MAARKRTAGTTREQQALLDALRYTGNITAAAEAANVHRRRHYEWVLKSPEYKAQFDEIMATAQVVCEQEALHRALVGRTRKKFFKGEPIIDPATGQQYEETEPSDQLLMFMLKALDPQKYRDRSDVNHTGNVGVTLELMKEAHEALLGLHNGDRTYTQQLIRERINSRQSVNGDVRRNGKPR